MIYPCVEKGRVVHRTVRQLSPVTEEVLGAYDKLAACANLFGDRSVESIEQMLREYWKFWLVDDVGLLCFDPFRQGEAHVHITFWDRRLRGREGLCRELAKSLMLRHNVTMLLTVIPLGSRTVSAFARRVGFVPGKVEGDRQVYWASPWCFTMQNRGM